MGHWSAHDAQNTDVTFHGIARRLVQEKQFGRISMTSSISPRVKKGGLLHDQRKTRPKNKEPRCCQVMSSPVSSSQGMDLY